MDPTTQIALDDLYNRFTTVARRQIGDLDSKLEHRFIDIDEQQSARVKALENSLLAATTEFDSWRPGVDDAVADLKLEVSKLNKHMDRVMLDRSPTSGILDPPKSASAPLPVYLPVRTPTAPLGTPMTLTSGIMGRAWFSPTPMSRSRVCPFSTPQPLTSYRVLLRLIHLRVRECLTALLLVSYRS